MSVHSSRGGTGKTLLSTNLAVLYAQSGLNVALVDLDFRAPSLTGVFSKVIKQPVECFVNSYFDGRCSVEALMVDVSSYYNLSGRLLVGFSNPDVVAIRSTAEKSRAWEVSSVKRLFALRSKLFSERGIDYCIFDTSPGVQYTSVNAIVASDLSIIVTTLDSLDLQGTKSMLSELYDAFERKTLILLNKVFPESHIWSKGGKAELIKQVEENLRRPVLGAIPCYCDVLQADRSKILAIEERDHPFVRDLENVRDILDTMSKCEEPIASI